MEKVSGEAARAHLAIVMRATMPTTSEMAKDCSLGPQEINLKVITIMMREMGMAR